MSDPGNIEQRTFDTAFQLQRLYEQVAAIRQGQVRHDTQFMEVRRDLMALDQRVEHMDQRLGGLDHRVTEGFRDVGTILREIVARLGEQQEVLNRLAGGGEPE